MPSLKRVNFAKYVECLISDYGEDAKSAWKKLRNNHRDALRRRKRITKSGAAAADIKPCKIEAQMEFLLQDMANETRGTNFNNEENNSEVEEIPEQLQDEEAVDNPEQQVVEESGRPRLNEAADVGEDTATNKVSNAPMEQAPSVKKPKTMKKPEIDSLIVKSLEQREQREKQRDRERKAIAEQIAPPNDDLHLFFMSMYFMSYTW